MPDRDAPELWRGVRWGLRALVALPIVVAVVRAVVHDWFPVGDTALLAVRVADVGTQHHPLLGSWTSASLALGRDVNNPGPLYYDLVAPFHWVFGGWLGIGPATAIGVGALNLAGVAGIAVVANRLGGWRCERWMLLMTAALAWTMGSELLFDLWQPHALLIPFALVLVLSAAVVAGQYRALPIWLGVVSVVVQTHVAYAYVVAALGIGVTAAAWRASSRRPEGSRLRDSATARWVAVVGIAAWCQPLWEQLFGRGQGNLSRLVASAGGGTLTVGGGTAIRIVGKLLVVPPWWTRPGFADTIPSTPITQTTDGPELAVSGLPAGWLAFVGTLAVVGVLAAGVLLVRDERQRGVRATLGVALGAVVVGVAGLAAQAVSTTGLGNHQLRSLFVTALFAHAAIAWALAEWVHDRRPVGLATPIVGVMIAALAVANLPEHAQPSGPVADRSAAETLRATFRDLDRFDPGGPIVFDTDNLRVFEPYSGAVHMALRERGVEFRFEQPGMVRQYGDHRRADGSEVGHLRQFERSAALAYDGPGCVVSSRSGVSAADEKRTDRLVAAAADALTGSQIDTAGLPEAVAALADAAAGGDRRAAAQLVADALLPVLVDDERVAVTPPVQAAVDATEAIVARVNSTLLLVAEPPELCG